jgi:uncharacterized protein with PIN domain
MAQIQFNEYRHGSGYGHCASLQLGDVFAPYAKGKAPRLLREAEGLASGSELFGCHDDDAS